MLLTEPFNYIFLHFFTFLSPAFSKKSGVGVGVGIGHGIRLSVVRDAWCVAPSL